MDIERFKQYLIKAKTTRGRFRKPRTVDLHIQTITRLTTLCPTLTLKSINTFLATQYESGNKATYINDYIYTLRVYGRFKKTNRYEKLEYYPEEEFIQETLSDEEIKAFLELPPATTKRYDPRTKKYLTYQFAPHHYKIWTLFFKILAYTGMRPGEVAHLTVDDCDFGKQVFKILPEHVKTNDFRYVPISPIIVSEVEAYVKSLSGTLLFPAPRGGMHRQGGVFQDGEWCYQFHTRLQRLGIKRKNLRTSSLRPSFITRMLAEDISISKIQKIVGHKRITTTAHYTHHTTKDIIESIKQDPLARGALTIKERMLQGRKALENLGLTVTSCSITKDGFIYKTMTILGFCMTGMQAQLYFS